MIEKTILEYLLDQEIENIGQNIFMEVPEDPPDRYIVIEKTASGMENRIRSALIAIQSISANSLLEAATTNETVVQLMDQIAENSNEVYSCKLNSDYNFTNIQTKEYRYQAVFNLYY